MSRSGVWGGRTAEQRQLERRRRMITAAVKIWSDEGWAAVSMRRICTETSVNDRYFYEQFGDKDGLLAASWETVRDDALGALTQAYAVWGVVKSWEEMTRQVALTLVDWITLNPAHTRILLSRDESSPALKELHRNAFERCVEMVLAVARPRMKADFDEQRLLMDTVAAVGGFLEVLRSWQSGYLKVDARGVVDHISSLVARIVHEPPSR